MGLMESMVYVIEKILNNLFLMQKIEILNNCLRWQIKKSVKGNIAFVLDVL